MGTAQQASTILVFSLLLQSLLVSSRHVRSFAASGDAIVKIPPFHLSQKDLLKYFSIENGDLNVSIPAIFVFGDSLVDSGNTKFMVPKEANSLAYGVDFDGNRYYRETNGRTMVDFIAQISGLSFPPPYLSLSESEKTSIRTGINYASSGCGILPDTTPLANYCMNFDKQISLFEGTVESMKKQLPSNEALADYLSKSLFSITVGGNDLGMSYNKWLKKHPSGGSEDFAKFLGEQLSTRLEKIYKLGARKFFVTNVYPLGCNVDQMLTHYSKQCVEEVNKPIRDFNNQLPSILRQLETTHQGFKFVHLDMYKVFEDVLGTPASYGITNTASPCCTVESMDGIHGSPLCAPGENKKICSNRNQHVFYDKVHPTEIMNFLMIKGCLNDSTVCMPTNLLQLLHG